MGSGPSEDSYLHLYPEAQRSLFPDMVESTYHLDIVEHGMRSSALDDRVIRYTEAHEHMVRLHDHTGLAAYVTDDRGMLIRAIRGKERVS